MISTLHAEQLLAPESSYGPDPELLSIRDQMRRSSGYNRFPSVGVAGQGAFSLDDLRGVAGGLVRRVRFRSNVTPTIEWDPSQPSGPGTPVSEQLGEVGRIVQPAIDVELSTGQTETYAPAGEPTEGSLLLVGGAVVIGSLGAAGLIGYLIGRSGRRR